MAIRVYFDGTRIPDVNIVGLRQYTHSLSNNFKLGSTVCRTFEIDVLKRAVATQPSVVEIREEGTVYAGKLVVDDRVEAKRHMLDCYPNLKGMYSETDPNTAVLYFESATATIYSFTDEAKAPNGTFLYPIVDHSVEIGQIMTRTFDEIFLVFIR